MKMKDGRKVNQVTSVAATAPARNRLSGPNKCLGVAADKADEGNHHDQRPRRGFAEREAVDHLWRAEPAEVLTAP
jgi:hypothetical protein